MGVYRDIETHAPDYQPMEFWSSEDEQTPAEWLAGLQGTAEGDGDGRVAAEVVDFPAGGETTA
jgi:hypothetical protein